MDTKDIDKLRTAGLRRVRKKFPSLNQDEREDVVQDALIRLVRKSPDAALLNTIIDGVAKNLIRAKSSRAKIELPAGDTADLSILSDNRHMTIDGAIFAADFDRTLRDLPEDERDAFILTDLRGLTVYEAGLHLGVLPTTVAARVERAKATFREEL